MVRIIKRGGSNRRRGGKEPTGRFVMEIGWDEMGWTDECGMTHLTAIDADGQPCLL